MCVMDISAKAKFLKTSETIYCTYSVPVVSTHHLVCESTLKFVASGITANCC